MKSEKGKTKDKGEATTPVWTVEHDSKLEEALKEHPNDYAKILKDEKYSAFFGDWNRGQLRSKRRSKLSNDDKNRNIAAQGNVAQMDMEHVHVDGEQIVASDDLMAVNNTEPILPVRKRRFMRNIEVKDNAAEIDMAINKSNPMMEAIKANSEAVNTIKNLMLQVLTKMDTMIDLMKVKKEEEEEEEEEKEKDEK